MESELEALRREDETLQLKIIELIELAERFEREHDENLEQISRYENRLLETQIALKQLETFITADILCFGRTASGERFDHGRVAQRLQIRRGGKLVWYEQGALRGGDAGFDGPLGLNGRTVCATLLAVGRQASAACVQALREEPSPQFGVTQMKSVLVARYIGDSSQEARRLMHRAWRLLRPALLDRDAVTPRIWNT